MARSAVRQIFNELAGLPALQRSEPGQSRKEAAITTYCECRGKARLLFSRWNCKELIVTRTNTMAISIDPGKTSAPLRLMPINFNVV
jgi:hypothetical protein